MKFNFKKIIASYLSIPLMVFSLNASADFIDSDWLTEGDNQVTLDEDTGIEWLKLNNTIGKSINQVLADDTYAGWRLPTNEEVENLVRTANPQFTFNDGYTYIHGTWSAYSVPSSEFGYLLGITGSFSDKTSSGKVSYGLHTNNDGGATITGSSYYNLVKYGGAISDETKTYNLSYSKSDYGVFLVSDGGLTLSSIQNPSININNLNSTVGSTPVPEPSSLALLGLTLMGFASAKRKTKKA